LQSDEELTGLEGEQQSPATTIDSGVGGTPEDELRLSMDEEQCLCFLEVDSYNSRSKPFSPNLLSIKKKVMDSEYSSLTQFHEDMTTMVETAQSDELMELYHLAVKEVRLLPILAFPSIRVRKKRRYPCNELLMGSRLLIHIKSYLEV